MADNFLWSPIDKNNFLTEFITSLNKKNFFKGNDYELLHKWSINNKKKFWSEVWNFTSIIGEYKDPVVENENDFINSIFFKNSKLNFSQNLIKIKDDCVNATVMAVPTKGAEQGVAIIVAKKPLKKSLINLL